MLGWVRGTDFSAPELQRVFYATRFGRTLDRAGYVRFRRWRLYAERGLRGEAVVVWLYGERLTLAFSDEPLAQYTVAYQPDKRHLKAVTEERRFATPHRSPQPPLWDLGDMPGHDIGGHIPVIPLADVRYPRWSATLSPWRK